MSRPIPHEFGRYRIDRLLGIDPFGSLYIAQDASHQRSVLLRVLDGPAAADAEVRVRFDRATRLALAVYHDRLALVYEAGEADGTLFVAVKVPGGAPAGDWLRDRGPLPPVRVAYIIEQIADVLDAIHAKQIASGSVNIRSIWLSNDDIVTVTGLGMALGEMSPERDRRDLAALAYQLLTGQAYRPARAGDPERDRGRGAPQFPEPSPAVRGVLEQGSALEGSPFATTAALAAALRTAIEASPARPAARPRELDYLVHGRELVEKARLAASAGDWAQASRLADEALTLEPKNRDAQKIRDRAKRVAASQARAVTEVTPPVSRVRKKRLSPFASARIWLLLAPLAIGGIIVAAWLGWRAVVGLLTEDGSPTQAARPTSASAAGIPPTPTRTLVATRKPTVAPTARPSAAPTTPVPPSDTPTPPPASPTPSATLPAPTGTPSPSRAPTVTVESTATRQARQAPYPLSPNDGAVYHGATSDVVLRWSDVGALAPDEVYVVRIPHTRGEEVGVTRGTSWTVPSYMYWLRPANGELQWSVAVRIRTTDAIPGTALDWPAVSPEGPWRTFVLLPEAGSAPTAAATSQPTAEVTPEPTAEVTPEATAEPTAEPTVEPTTEATPEATVEASTEAAAGAPVDPPTGGAGSGIRP